MVDKTEDAQTAPWTLRGEAHAAANGWSPQAEGSAPRTSVVSGPAKPVPFYSGGWGDDDLRSADGPPPGVPAF